MADRPSPLWFETAVGRIPVWGDPGREGPVVFGVAGALPPFEQLEQLPTPGASFVRVHLPGMHSPPLADPSVQAFAQAYDEVIGSLLPGRTVVACGVSAGALAALALRAPEVAAVVVVEPFLSTAKLWPLLGQLRPMLREAPPGTGLAGWIEAIFGYGRERVQDRSYEHLLQGPARPLWVLAGDVPLMPERPVASAPSFTDEADRARLTARGARLQVLPGGHDLLPGNLAAIGRTLGEAVATVTTPRPQD